MEKSFKLKFIADLMELKEIHKLTKTHPKDI
jgi:hypothetical protein